MLIWTCALHCEAKPVIDNYRLQKIPGATPFDVYEGTDHLCIVTGIGKIAAAAAVASTAERYKTTGSLAWLNLGVAGAADQPLGETFLVNKSVDFETGQRLYPAIIGKPVLPTLGCLTVSEPVRDYHADQLHDMEASAFLQSAQYYSSSELVHSIKVVSDNRQEQIGKDRQRTSQLIADRMDDITRQAALIEQLNAEHNQRQLAMPDLAAFESLAAFSATRKHQLSHALNYLLNRGYEHDQLLEDCRGQSAAQIIAHLRGLGERDSRNL